MNLAVFPQVTESQIHFPAFYILYEYRFFQTTLAKFVTDLLEPVIAGHEWFWWILILIIFMLFSQTVSDEDLFEVGESCISKKTHFRFHLLFDYLWNEHRRWELVANPEERITRGIVVYLQNESRFLFFFFIPIYFKLVHFQENSFPLSPSLWLFMKWAPLRTLQIPGKNKQESWHRCLSAKLIKISFLLLPVCFQCVCFVCMCVCFLWYENNK